MKKVKHVHARAKNRPGPLCRYVETGKTYVFSDASTEVTCTMCRRALGIVPTKRLHPWSNRCMYHNLT